MSIIGKSIGAASLVSIVGMTIAAVGTGAVSIPNLASAQSVLAGSNMADLHKTQQLWLAVDGTYADSIEELASDEFGMAFTPRSGQHLAYAVNSTGESYIAAEQTPSGEIVVRSESEGPASCDEFNAACIAQVTDDAELLNAIPEFVTF